MAEGPLIAKDNEDLLRDLDAWLAARGGSADLSDVLATGDHLLFAAFLLKNFRKVAREAVFDTFKLKARKLGFADVESSTAAFFYMIDCIADAWSVNTEEKTELLGLEAASELEKLRNAPFQDIPPETLERAAILLDIFSVLNTIFSDRSVADDWIRTPNSARLFGGRSALAAMLGDGLSKMRKVRQYLWAVAAGN